MVIDIETGEAFASISAVARMCDVEKSTISRFCSVACFDLLKTEILTPAGIRSVALLNENQILDVASGYNPEILFKFAKIGLKAT